MLKYSSIRSKILVSRAGVLRRGKLVLPSVSPHVQVLPALECMTDRSPA
jgi:hypothetical protein